MIFEKQAPINIFSCAKCKSTGFLGMSVCKECGGLSMARIAREHLLFWKYPITRYHLSLQSARRTFGRVRFFSILILTVTCFLWSGWFVYRQQSLIIGFDATNPASFLNLLLSLKGAPAFLFYFGLIFCLYLWYHAILDKKKRGKVEKFLYNQKNSAQHEVEIQDWKAARKIKRANKLNIADTYTEEALESISRAYKLADSGGYVSVGPAHLFYSLLASNRAANVFLRLGILDNDLKIKVEKFFGEKNEAKKDSYTMPLPNKEFQQTLFLAYEESYASHQEYVGIAELLISTVKQSEDLQEILYDYGIDKQKLTNVVEWARIRERLHRQYIKFSRAASHRSKVGMDKAMTAVQTPFLNNFSEDITLLAQLGHLENCIAREEEIEEVFRIVDGGGQNVILVGDHGVGKMSIVEGIAQKMIEDDVPKRLRDKRLVRLSVPALLSGTTPAGAVERLIGIMRDVARAGNIILFIHNINELFGVSAGEKEGSLDVAGALNEYLGKGNFFTFATSSSEEYAKRIANSAMSNLFAKVDVKEMDENQAIQVLESKVGLVEYKNDVFFSYDAISKSVQMAKRFLRENYLPGSAQEIMKEAAVHAHTKKGPHALVTAEEVSEVVSQKTGVPVASVSADETSKLLRLEEEMHKRVIGQDEAVNLVANALRRARAEMRSSSRPIANFLFLGPTGVGKTELAKTIASVYFGSEEKMTRLDMSEYQDKASIYRLIGAPGEKGTGILTEAVRKSPFTLLLLDEIEKADKDILNLFLQVMDDGRLTDSVGRVVDFTNVILIATSNAGTSFVQEQMRAGTASEIIKEKLLHGELKQYFRPEFLNRFDGIVLFKALTKPDIKKVAAIMMKRIEKDLENKGVLLEVTDQALDFLADVGFDPEFGARPMRRALQERVENKLAEMILSNKLKRKDTVVIGAGGEISVK